MPDKGQRRPAKSSKKAVRPVFSAVADLPFDPPPNYEESHPIFCLQHLHGEFSVKHSSMTKDAKAAFAEQLESLASLTWATIKRAPRHGLGFEKIPVDQLKMSLPAIFEDEEDVMVFRYHGKLPMAGVRREATLHLVALERQFGELYDHD